MASITIRNLTDDDKERLREQAARHGRSMEAEARKLLREGLGKSAPRPDAHLVDQIRALFEPLGGLELPEIPRDPIRDPPDFK